jgi:hypothetical protein
LTRSSKAGCPGEGSFDDPSAWQENEAALGFGEFDDFERYAVLCCGIIGSFSGISLIDEGEVDAVVRGGLNGFQYGG